MSADAARGSEPGAVTFDVPPEPQRAGGRGRAVSITAAPRMRRGATPGAVTLRKRIRGHADSLRTGGHVTGRLPSLAQQHVRIHERAAEWSHPVLRYSSLAWGYFHLAVIQAPLTVVWWATETRTRLVFTGLLAFLAWKFG